MNGAHASVQKFYQYYWDRAQRAGLGAMLALPVTALWNNPKSLLGSLWNCLVLRRGNWSAYESFASAPAFMKMFYRTQALNLDRHGRTGTSTSLGSGAFAMRRFWYHSWLGVSLESSLGGVLVALLGMAAWWATHLLWMDTSDGFDLIALLALLAAPATSNFLGNLFIRQTYSALAWACFPVGIYGIFHQAYFLLAIVWTIVGAFHIGMLVFGMGFSLLAALLARDPWVFVATLPAATPFLLRSGVLDFERFGEVSKMISELWGAIGGKRSVKYVRPTRPLYVALYTALFLCLPVTLWFLPGGWGKWDNQDLAILAALPAAWFLVNQARVLRIADAHNLLMFYLSVSLAMVFLTRSPAILLLFWITNSNALIAFHLFRFDESMEESIRRAPVVAPFAVTKYETLIDQFLAAVPDGEKVLLSFAHPGNNYNLIFDGYSDLYQLLQYCAAKRNILVFPDWFQVMETIDADAPIWGRDPAEITQNMKAAPAGYVITYRRPHEAETRLADATSLSHLDWQQAAPELQASPCFADGWMEWRLLSTRVGEKS